MKLSEARALLEEKELEEGKFTKLVGAAAITAAAVVGAGADKSNAADEHARINSDYAAHQQAGGIKAALTNPTAYKNAKLKAKQIKEAMNDPSVRGSVARGGEREWTGEPAHHNVVAAAKKTSDFHGAVNDLAKRHATGNIAKEGHTVQVGGKVFAKHPETGEPHTFKTARAHAQQLAKEHNKPAHINYTGHDGKAGRVATHHPDGHIEIHPA